MSHKHSPELPGKVTVPDEDRLQGIGWNVLAEKNKHANEPCRQMTDKRGFVASVVYSILIVTLYLLKMFPEIPEFAEFESCWLILERSSQKGRNGVLRVQACQGIAECP
jgi:hypothetical protein